MTWFGLNEFEARKFVFDSLISSAQVGFGVGKVVFDESLKVGSSV